ncbi:hypothetical protein GCM10011363_15090 [Marivita lacus]|uniref:Uncharacterized protein n=1 Tax=Marivita lacus TaxID=1323742 RepID=A0ABQ1KKF0_9RHOB|nr:hypothetical protein [Marivita lacus]GGB99383.1 hypothetical protein GCM10011363_15090 [Marivita lacus]
MYTKIYQIKTNTLADGKIAASYVAEELGGLIAQYNITALNILLCKEGALYVTVNFDEAADMKVFQTAQLELFENLRTSLKCHTADFQAIPVFRYEREATNATLESLAS